MTFNVDNEYSFYKTVHDIEKWISDNDIYNLHESKFKKFFCYEMGITISGFMLYDFNKGSYIHYQNPGIDNNLAKYPRIGYERGGGDYEEFLDLVFIGSRYLDDISGNAKDPEFHDYFNNTKEGEENELLNYMYYRSEGDVLFYLYAWRYFVKQLSVYNIGYKFEDYKSFDADSFGKPLVDKDKFLDIVLGYSFNKIFNYVLDKEKSNRDKKTKLRYARDRYIDYEYQDDTSLFVIKEWQILGINPYVKRGRYSLLSLIDYIINSICMDDCQDPGLLKINDDLARLRKTLYETCVIDGNDYKSIIDNVHKLIVKYIFIVFRVEGKSIIELFGEIYAAAGFPIFPYYLEMLYDDSNQDSDNNYSPKNHLVFPVWKSSRKGKNENVVYVMLSCEAFWSIGNRFDIWGKKDIENKHLFRIKYLFTMISDIVIEEGYYENVVNAEKKNASIRAALSQVMARNMSHNIGSHVIGKLNDRIKKMNWDNLQYNSIINPKLLNDLKKEDIKDSVLDQVSIFNKYIKCRMDFLGDIALGTPTMLYTKSLINIMHDFDIVRLLMENISGKNDFNYQINICSNVNDDIYIAIPNDLLGCQALYNIIENIIRNTAKHGKTKAVNNKLPITFTLKIIDDLDDLFYKVCIYDSNILNKNEMKGVVNSQNDKINDTVIDQDFKLRQKSLGVVEIKACASYLRKVDISKIDDTVSPSLLTTFMHSEKRGHNMLGYEFYVLKPKEILYVKKEIDEKDYVTDKLKRKGINLIDYRQFKTKLSKGIVVDHKFIVYDSYQQFKSLLDSENISPMLPLRHYEDKYDLSEINKKEDNVNELILSIWSKWLKKNKIQRKIAINTIIPGEQYIGFENHSNEDNLEKVKKHIDSSDVYYEPLSSMGMRYMPFYDALSKSYYKEEYKFMSEKMSEFELYINNLDENHDDDEEKYDNYKLLRDIALCELSESSTTKIIVIDERIQKARNYDFCGNEYKDLFQLMNVFVPNDDKKDKDSINLSGKELKSQKEWFSKKLSEIIDGVKWNRKKMTLNDFLVIHYGILEDITQNDKSEINKYLEKWSKKCSVVVTSGRNIISQLPDKVRFTSVSNIENSLLIIRNKHYLTNILHASRMNKG